MILSDKLRQDQCLMQCIDEYNLAYFISMFKNNFDIETLTNFVLLNNRVYINFNNNSISISNTSLEFIGENNIHFIAYKPSNGVFDADSIVNFFSLVKECY